MSTPRFPGRFCRNPFDEASIDQEGEVYFCSQAWLPLGIGNVRETPLDEIWNSPWAQKIRESILDGSYRYCNAENCPHLQGEAGNIFKHDELPDPRYEEIVRESRTVLDHGPRHVTIGYDPTCNLACPSCRCDYVVAKGDTFRKAEDIHARVFNSKVLDHAEVLLIPNMGEVFSSRIYRHILRTWDRTRYPALQIQVLSNGLLLTEGMWESISQSHGVIRDIKISINAARPDSFAEIQKGGDFGRLMENLRFIQKLRETGQIDLFVISFVVQTRNFREMKEFVELGKELGVDSVLFSSITNWGTFPEDDFSTRAVHVPGHPCHEELKQILLDPIFQDSIVELGNLSHLHPDFKSEIPITPSNVSAPATLDDMAECVLLTAEQKTVIGRLIDDFKDEVVRVLGRAPSMETSPIDRYVADIQDGVTESECVARLSRFAAQARDPETGLTYNEAIIEAQSRTSNAINALLDTRQWVAMSTAFHVPPNDIDTGRDAFCEEIKRRVHALGHPNTPATTAPNDWRVIRQELGLDDLRAGAALALLNELKDRFVQLCRRSAGGGNPSPLEELVDRMHGGIEAAQREFLRYLGAEKPDGDGDTYAVQLAALESQYRSRLADLLNESQRAKLPCMTITSLLDVHTGHDPFAKAIEQLRAPAPENGHADSTAPRASIVPPKHVGNVSTWDGLSMALSLRPRQMQPTLQLLARLQETYAASQAASALTTQDNSPALEEHCRRQLRELLQRPQWSVLDILPLGTLLALKLPSSVASR